MLSGAECVRDYTVIAKSLLSFTRQSLNSHTKLHILFTSTAVLSRTRSSVLSWMIPLALYENLLEWKRLQAGDFTSVTQEIIFSTTETYAGYNLNYIGNRRNGYLYATLPMYVHKFLKMKCYHFLYLYSGSVTYFLTDSLPTLAWKLQTRVP